MILEITAAAAGAKPNRMYEKFQLYRYVQCSISRLNFRHRIGSVVRCNYFVLASPEVVRIAGVTIIFRQHRNEQPILIGLMQQLIL